MEAGNRGSRMGAEAPKGGAHTDGGVEVDILGTWTEAPTENESVAVST